MPVLASEDKTILRLQGNAFCWMNSFTSCHVTTRLGEIWHAFCCSLVAKVC